MNWVSAGLGSEKLLGAEGPLYHMGVQALITETLAKTIIRHTRQSNQGRVDITIGAPSKWTNEALQMCA